LIRGYAQKLPYQISIINASNDTIKHRIGVTDSINFVQIIKAEYLKLLTKGHVLASVNYPKKDSITCYATLQMGEIYKWGRFNVDQIPEALLSKIGFKKKQFENNQLISIIELGKLMIKIIDESEVSGYPFVSIKLDSVSISSNIISAIVNYNTGPQIKYADLIISDSSLVKSKYLEAYLEIREGDLFNSKNVEGIVKKMDRLTYCKLSNAPVIKFENKSCKITLNILPIKANKIDAMLGLAPNQKENSKLLATGYVDLDLHNLFKSGKRLSFNWRQFSIQSQKLALFYNHTNLFNSALNVSGAFDLLKQDTVFINRNIYVGVGYDKVNYTINLTSQYLSSRLLSNTISMSVSNLSLIDFDAQFYGVEFIKNELDNRINPANGWSLESSINLGSKKLHTTNFVPVEMYDSLDKQTLQGSASTTAEIAIPISKIFVGYSKVRMGAIKAKSNLFNNDLFRLGGVNSIRGFNELDIFASSYVMLQLEGRLLLSENSRIFGFVDWAYTDNKVLFSTERYVGLGGGMLLDTNSGVIQFVYAVGKSSKQLLSLAESKIHLGYVATF